jgi:hypothetical protein
LAAISDTRLRGRRTTRMPCPNRLTAVREQDQRCPASFLRSKQKIVNPPPRPFRMSS